MKVRKLFFLCLVSILPLTGGSQDFSLSTNVLGYLNFGTINGEFGLSVTPKWSIYLQGKYNPFTFTSKDKVQENGYLSQKQNRQLAAAIGAKYWFWHTNAGWFVSSQLNYIQYNTGGIFKSDTYEGDAYGVTLGAGYALMLTKHLNLDLGLGIMAGYTSYTKYLCPKCGKIVGRDKRVYVAPGNLLLQLSYLF
ncbi:MAG: DUF3575 domain-containing protein [Bacteroidales bacterium]